MRRVWSTFIAVALLIVLSACGSDEETRTFQMNGQGVESTLTYTYSGDEVISQTTEKLINYEELGIDRSQAEEIFTPLIEEYENLSGVEHSFEFSDDQAVENLLVVYGDIDYEEIQTVEGISLDGDPAEGVSMERSAEMLLDLGYTEVEE